MKRHKGLYSASLLSAAAIALFSAAPAMARDGDDDRAAKAAARADATLDRMMQVERTIFTGSIMPLPLGDGPVAPPDASLDLFDVMGLWGDGETALPSGLAQASSWNKRPYEKMALGPASP